MINQTYRLLGRGIPQVGREVGDFLQRVSAGNVLFRRGVQAYLEHGGIPEAFQGPLRQMMIQEQEGEALRRLAETHLLGLIEEGERYTATFELLERLGALLHRMARTLAAFDIEHPVIPSGFHPDIRELTEPVSLAVEGAVEAAGSLLKNTLPPEEYLTRVSFYEKEADKFEDRLLRAIFASNLPLDAKGHLRHFIERIDEPADIAEELVTWLSIHRVSSGLDTLRHDLGGHGAL
ncbi:MAG: hypothetical protein HQL56_13870 [Magnetococcales bacterium]|nr:hypothetical protein [Magnetococcales bacterium]